MLFRSLTSILTDSSELLDSDEVTDILSSKTESIHRIVNDRSVMLIVYRQQWYIGVKSMRQVGDNFNGSACCSQYVVTNLLISISHFNDFEFKSGSCLLPHHFLALASLMPAERNRNTKVLCRCGCNRWLTSAQSARHMKALAPVFIAAGYAYRRAMDLSYIQTGTVAGMFIRLINIVLVFNHNIRHTNASGFP